MSLHPDKYGYPIDNDVTTSGLNRNDSVPPESSYIRCKKCGFTMSKDEHQKGRGEGVVRHSTQLSAAVSAGATSISVDATTGFPTPVSGTASYIYIYDAGVCTTDEDASTWAPASGGSGMNKVQYTGLTSTTFTGCTGATAHADNSYVRGEVGEDGSGCPFCRTYNYEQT